MPNVPTWAVIGLSLTSALSVHAQPRLTYLTQSRGFISWVGVGPVTFETYAPNFNPFIGWSRLDLPNSSGIDSVGYASQRSWLNPDGIVFEATNFGTDGNPGQWGSGGGTSFLNVTFSISEPATFAMTTTFDVVGNDAGSDWNVTLSSQDTVYFSHNSDSDFNSTYPYKAVLQPGVYRLYVTMAAGWMGELAGDGGGFAGVSLKVTEPAHPR